MLFSSKSNYPIGLDISDFSIKIAQLNKKGEKITIQSIGQTTVPKGLIDNGEIKDKEKTAEIIKKLIYSPGYGRITSNEAIASLPDSRTYVKLIRVEKNLNQLEHIIEAEIEKNIPFPLSDIYFDWQTINQNIDSYDILVGASPKNIVDQYTELMKNIGLSIPALEVEPIAVCRCLLREESPTAKTITPGNYCIIDLGDSSSCLIFYAKNTLLFTFSLPLCGDEIIEKVAETLKIDRAKAEKAKSICGFDENCGEGVVKKIMAEKINEMTGKIAEAFDFYKTNFADSGEISQIYLTGGGANLKKIDTIIQEKTNIPTAIGNVSAHLKISNEDLTKILKDTAKDDANHIMSSLDPAFATVIGLALRGIFADK